MEILSSILMSRRSFIFCDYSDYKEEHFNSPEMLDTKAMNE